MIIAEIRDGIRTEIHIVIIAEIRAEISIGIIAEIELN